MSFAKRIGVLILLPLVGALIASALAYANYDGRFVAWESLGKPPEKAVKFVAIASGLWVEAESGHIYRYEGGPSCGDQCWATSTYPTPEPTPFFPLDRCGRVPSFAQATDTQAICAPWGPGSYLSVYAIRNDGNVFRWEHGIGEGNSMEVAFFPCIGGGIGFLVAIIIVLAKGQTAQHNVQPDEGGQ